MSEEKIVEINMALYNDKTWGYNLGKEINKERERQRKEIAPLIFYYDDGFAHDPQQMLVWPQLVER